MEFSPIFYFRNESDRLSLADWRRQFKQRGEKLVFTNGVFDILHAGHVSYLAEARSMGDALIIGLNADESVRRIKGPKRPLQTESDRALVLASLRSTDAVVIFDAETPLEPIEFILPDVLVKGGDWSIDSIVGRDAVERNGGIVKPLPFIEGRSTTGIVERIIDRYADDD